MTTKPGIPAYLCSDCAKKFPQKYKTLGYGFTMHINICPVCNEEKALASAADYGLE